MEEASMEKEEVMMGSIETPLPSWKLYDNPHYSDSHHDSTHHPPHPYNSLPPPSSTPPGSPLPMDCDAATATASELDLARAQIKELRAELELERRARRRAESMNRVLARQLAEERRGREAAESLRAKLADEAARARGEAERAAKEVEEERRMLRIAEVWREERVQMKLSEARLLMEEKLREMCSEEIKSKELEKESQVISTAAAAGRVTPPKACRVLASSENDACGSAEQQSQQRREVENPHIRRGIKGFVEFPRVLRVRSFHGRDGRSGHVQGPNLECQKAQLRILLRHRNTVTMGFVGTAENLVV